MLFVDVILNGGEAAVRDLSSANESVWLTGKFGSVDCPATGCGGVYLRTVPRRAVRPAQDDIALREKH